MLQSRELANDLLGDAVGGSLQGKVYIEPYIREDGVKISWLEKVILVYGRPTYPFKE